MSWFFGGGNNDDKSSSSSSQSHSTMDSAPTFDTSSSSFGHDSSSFAAPSAGYASSGSFEQTVMQEQQRALVQTVMFRLTEMSFDACVTKPGSSLSSSEKACITAVTSKYLETSEFIVGAMGGGQH